MHGSTLPVWLVILILGTIIVLSFGFFNPFVSERSRRRMKAFSKKESSVSSKKIVIKVRYHFARSSYMAITLIMSTIVVISFAIENFSSMNAVSDYILKLFCVLFSVGIYGGLLMVASISLEQFRSNAIIRYYEKRYHVKMIKDEE